MPTIVKEVYVKKPVVHHYEHHDHHHSGHDDHGSSSGGYGGSSSYGSGGDDSYRGKIIIKINVKLKKNLVHPHLQTQ